MKTRMLGSIPQQLWRGEDTAIIESIKCEHPPTTHHYHVRRARSFALYNTQRSHMQHHVTNGWIHVCTRTSMHVPDLF